MAGLSLVVIGCGQVGMLQAKMAFRDAKRSISGQDYRGAAVKYEEAIAADPNLTAAYFFLGNSYDNLYRPARRGEAANDELLTKAVENYKKAAEIGADDPKIRPARARVSRGRVRPRQAERPVAAGAARAADDPDESERADELLRLAKIYEDNGDYEARRADAS